MANPSFDLFYGKEKKGVGEGQFTAELLKNRASPRDEAGKTLLLIFNISASTTGHCWTQPASELQGLDVSMCSQTCFLQSSWCEKANIYTQVLPCLRPSSTAGLGLTQLGTPEPIPVPSQAAEPTCSRSCSCQPSQAKRANTACTEEINTQR